MGISLETMRIIAIILLCLTVASGALLSLFAGICIGRENNKTISRISLAIVAIFAVFMVGARIAGDQVSATNTTSCNVAAIETVLEDGEKQYQVITSEGTVYMVDEDSLTLKVSTENAGTAEISTYKLLSKDGTEIVKSMVLYIGSIEVE